MANQDPGPGSGWRSRVRSPRCTADASGLRARLGAVLNSISRSRSTSGPRGSSGRSRGTPDPQFQEKFFGGAGTGTRTPDPRLKSSPRTPQDASSRLLLNSILRISPPRGTPWHPGLAIRNGYISEGLERSPTALSVLAPCPKPEVPSARSQREIPKSVQVSSIGRPATIGPHRSSPSIGIV